MYQEGSCLHPMKSDAAESANASSGSAGAKPVRNPEREKLKWEDEYYEEAAEAAEAEEAVEE